MMATTTTTTENTTFWSTFCTPQPPSTTSSSITRTTTAGFGFGHAYNDEVGGGGGGGGTGASNNNNAMMMELDDNTTNTTTTNNNEVTADLVGGQELNSLLPKQRERLYEEIHGVYEGPMETTDFISNKLQELDNELFKIRDNKSAYNKALFLSPTLVKNSKFRIMFLRFTNWDCKLAAIRMIQHFQYKSELFGIEKVGKHITFQDLSNDDKIALLTGAIQLLQCKDRSGRRVLFIAQQYSNHKTILNAFRGQWWYIMSELENNDELQKSGIVSVGYTIGSPTFTPSKVAEYATKFYIVKDGLPIRRSAFHFCHTNNTMKPVIALFRTLAGSEFRMRFRDHYGSHQECKYQLLAFGIDTNYFPFNDQYELVTDTLHNYIELQREKEYIQYQHESKLVIGIKVPNPQDVLLGRGIPYQSHPGNIQLARLIEMKHPEYMKANRIQKTKLSWEIVQQIQQVYGGRFLVKDTTTGTTSNSTDKDSNTTTTATTTTSSSLADTWKVVPDEVAREKSAYGFRSVKKLQILGYLNDGGGGGGQQDQQPTTTKSCSNSSNNNSNSNGNHGTTMMMVVDDAMDTTTDMENQPYNHHHHYDCSSSSSSSRNNHY